MNDFFGYIKLGRLNKRIADKIGRKPADIYIEYNHLRHIENGKYFALKDLNMNSFVYVQNIVSNFTEIRKGRADALILVAHMKANNKENIAIIELQLISKKSMYLVKTAMPRKKFAESETILWQK
jgi:hypothetical protein